MLECSCNKHIELHRNMKKFSSKLYSILYQALCYVLLLVNLIYVSSKYFIYDTDTSVGFYSSINITSPNLSLCFDLNTIVGGYEPMMFYPHKPYYVGRKDRFLFSKVPKVDKILRKCAYRDSQVDQFKYASNGSNCLNIFNIKRYRMQNLMCYLFQVIEERTFNLNALSFSVNEPRLLYKLVIDAPLNAAGHTVVPLVHFDELAEVDRMFMKEIYPSRRKNQLYYLNYQLFEIYRLPSPYKTHCGADPLIRCSYKCMTRRYAELGLTTCSGYSLEAFATATSKVIDCTINSNLKDLLEYIDDLCLYKTCKYEACEQKLVITHTSGPFENELDRLSFVVGSFKHPINKIIHSAKLPLMEYLTNFFSLSGIWVGFSVVGCITRKNKPDVLTTYKKWRLICSELTRKFPREFLLQTFRVDTQTRTKGKWMRKIVLVGFKVAVALVFSIQAINQCILYFQFQTILHHEHIVNPEFKFVLPSTAVCMDLYQLLFKQPQILTEDNFDRLWSGGVNLTIGQLLHGTMDEEILFKCRTRDYGGSEFYKGIFQLKSNEECLKAFRFRKYFSNWQVCYVFRPPFLSRTHDQWELVFRETNPSKLYSLILNPKVKHLDHLNFVLFFPDDSLIPYGSSEYPAISQKTTNKRVVMLTFHTEIQESLPKPYDTSCNPFLNDKLCREKCFEGGLSQFNLVPFQNTISEKFHSKLLTYNHLKNVTLYKYWLDLERKCHSSCLLNLCSANITMTYSSNFPGKSEFDVEVLVNTEAGPRIRSVSLPRFPFYDFYYQMFCLFTFWLDFSFVGLNLIRKRREKLVSENAKLLYTKSTQLLHKLSSVRHVHVSMHSTRKSLFHRCIFKVICVAGMCIHLVIPLAEYFRYPTVLLSTITLERPLGYRLSLCSETQNLYERGIIFGGEKVNKHRRDIFNKSIHDILSEAERSIKPNLFCGYWGRAKNKNECNDMTRMTDRIFFQTDNSSLCREMFLVRTSLIYGRTCFQFELRREHNWTRTQMFNTLNGVKTIFTVSIQSSLISPHFTVQAHQHKMFEPYHSAIWTPSVIKEAKFDSLYVISYVLYVVEALPHPYSDKGFTPGHYTHCFYHCTNSKLQQFNLTRTYVGHELSKYKIVSNSLRGNGPVNSLVNEVDKACDRKCSSSNFGTGLKGNKLPFTITLISEPQPHSGPKKGFTRFDLRRTDDPVIKMKFLVAISIYDLIINVGSIINIWFGLSVNILDLMTTRSDEQIYTETQDNLKRTKNILTQMHN